MQDLSGFSVPKGFRGGNATKVQLWQAIQATIFAQSPQVLYHWWIFLLHLFNVKIRKNVVIRPSVETIYPWELTLSDYARVGDDASLYTLGEVIIGTYSVISQKSYLYTGSHDRASQYFIINTTPTVIDEKCWLATGVPVVLGVTIGDGTVVGVRSSIFKSFPANVVCQGSPIVVICECVETE